MNDRTHFNGFDAFELAGYVREELTACLSFDSYGAWFVRTSDGRCWLWWASGGPPQEVSSFNDFERQLETVFSNR